MEQPARWSGVVTGPGQQQKGALEVDPDQPDLGALVKYARRGSTAL